MKRKLKTYVTPVISTILIGCLLLQFNYNIFDSYYPWSSISQVKLIFIASEQIDCYAWDEGKYSIALGQNAAFEKRVIQFDTWKQTKAYKKLLRQRSVLKCCVYFSDYQLCLFETDNKDYAMITYRTEKAHYIIDKQVIPLIMDGFQTQEQPAV